MYLLPQDYSYLINSDNLQDLSESSPDKITRAILASIDEAKMYLNVRYDLTKEIQDVKQWSNAVEYKQGNRVYDLVLGEYLIYEQISEAPQTGTLLTDATVWSDKDTRNNKLVQSMCDMFIYHFHAIAVKRNTPELRQIRYEMAIAFLKDAVKPNFDLGIPVKENPDTGEPLSRIKTASNPKNINDYWC